ncbi:MAG: hypothetical protein ACK42D_02765 [Candidatus Paceibacteria bacterium]
MDGSKYDELVLTLYGVVHEGMKDELDFSEIKTQIQKWFAEKGGFYLRTDVDMRGGNLYVVVYYNTSLEAVLAGQEYITNNVPVPQNYLAKAEEYYNAQ